MDTSIPSEFALVFQLMDNMPSMAYYCDVNGDCKYVNAAYTAFTGRTAEDIGNFRWKGLKLVHPDDVAAVTTAWRKSMEEMTPYTAEYRLLHVSGEFRWVRSKAFYVKDKAGIAIAWFGNIEDIHDDKMRKINTLTDLRDELGRMTKQIIR